MGEIHMGLVACPPIISLILLAFPTVHHPVTAWVICLFMVSMRRVFCWKAALDSKVKICSFVLSWILHPLDGEGGGVISESELWGFAGKPVASARWSRQGACSLYESCGKAESTDTEVTEKKLSETVRGSLLQSKVKSAGWRARSQGKTDTRWCLGSLY